MIASAEFIISAPDSAALVLDDLPEIAIVGRSNVGKSTLINRLCNRKNLAKTSSTPGKTQLLNAFKVSFNQNFYNMIDLPGYGYAKVSKGKRVELHNLILDYVTEREQLSVLVLLQEARRKTGEDELLIQHLAFERELPLIIVLTKSDKLNQKQRASSVKERAQEFNLLPKDLVLSGEKQSTKPIWERIQLASLGSFVR